MQRAEAVATRIGSRLVEHTMHDLVISPLTKLLSLLLRPASAHIENPGQALS
ncbi:hypothetical protein [Saccharopolyspora sp. 5N708]|uniref:hypothetical protein n=1 Tax=Saccharopolyspora sp. 5N708 TaxID=3457424 RepID=UPI003FD5AB92